MIKVTRKEDWVTRTTEMLLKDQSNVVLKKDSTDNSSRRHGH